MVNRAVRLLVVLSVMMGLVMPLGPGVAVAQEHTGSDVHLLSDGQFVYGPNVADFDLAAYLDENSPTLSPLAQDLNDKASYYSINPRVLLTILEIRSGAVTADPPLSQVQMDSIVGYQDIVGYDDQLFELGKTLMESYYRRLYSAPPDEKVTIVLTLNNGTTIHVPTITNAGTLAILTALAPLSSLAQWQTLTSSDDPEGFLQTYRRLFPEDNPLDDSNQVIAPQAPSASLLKFPFACNDTWVFSSGPHDNDGDCSGGDPYSAVDFAPGVGYCMIPSDRWIVSPAAGTVSDVSCGGCQVKVNHQDEWVSYFYHVANPQVSTGQGVSQDQHIGNPSTKPTCGGDCGGCPGDATGTHVHYALMYRGAFVAIEGTAFEGWVVHGTSCYNGYLEKEGQQEWKGSWVTSECGSPPPPCPQSGGVILYKHAGYDCDGEGEGSGYVIRSGTGWENVPSPFNDRASSVKVPSGWSVKLYEHNDRGGGWACRTGDDDNFWGDHFNNGVSLNDKVSSFEVFDSPDCGEKHPPNAPDLLDPHDWYVSHDGQAPTLCWRNNGDPDGDSVEFHVEVRGAVDADSSWTTTTCWRPGNLDGHYHGYI